ncbi:MAG TPA: TVP38/TMEM64 family protein [Hyphomicrobiaceae bacterium]|nr:TVP38/TMEM64 family protein [Hyphomicrobiaceae bacterium]
MHSNPDLNGRPAVPSHPGTPRGVPWRAVVPLAVFAVCTSAFFGLGWHEYLTFEQLRDNRGALMSYVSAMPLTAVMLFLATYAVMTALSLPGGAVLTVAGGFLFGMWEGTFAVVVGATLGATALFLTARTALGDVLKARAGPWLSRMEAGFRQNALSYMLVLRLVPGFPFFVVNLVPAFLGVPLRTYVLATFVGIIPGTFVFASIGAGLGSIFDSMEEFSIKGALTPEVILALGGLAILSLIPVVWKQIKRQVD